MGIETKIEWADDSVNIWWGCTHRGTGCLNCYAEKLTERFHPSESFWGPNAPRLYCKDWKKNLRKIEKLAQSDGKRRMVFVNSMSDFFEDSRPLVVKGGGPAMFENRLVSTTGDARREFFQVADAMSNSVVLLLLTKRPENVRQMIPWFDNGASESSSNFLAWRWRSNVWLGTSVACRADVHNIDELRKCKELSSKLFVSFEPLVEDVGDDVDLTGIDWAIIGGESGENARMFSIGWCRKLIKRARECGCSPFMKQAGANVLGVNVGWPEGTIIPPIGGKVKLRHPKGGDPLEWPEDIRVREIPG